MMWRARDSIRAELGHRRVQVALGLGGYVTIPTALAARAAGVPLMIAEQNAEAGLANRVASRWARRVFVSFPDTLGLAAGSGWETRSAVPWPRSTAPDSDRVRSTVTV
jgi:UDP-N-acetylglucosamine--N-acetylmuramyl-(pentapeptide) pyrophosphoryl-undecaprenol N-acetylglucosamine transferase